MRAVPSAPAERRADLELPGEAASVPQARRFVREVLRAWGRQRYDEAGSLLVTELTANAVLHARTNLVVELVDRSDGVLLSVSDSSPALPVQRRHSREAGTGRGLWLLEQYAASFGVDVRATGTGKRVWALLAPEDDTALEGSDGVLASWLDEVEGL